MKTNKIQMPLAEPTVSNEDNQTYLRWGHLRYWIDDIDQITVGCIEDACEEVGESTDLAMLVATIDEIVDATDGAVAVYINPRKWEAA